MRAFNLYNNEMLNHNNSLFKIFYLKKKPQSWHITFSSIIYYYQYHKIKFNVFILQYYNLLILFIIVICYICLNLGDSYVECVKGRQQFGLVKKSLTHYDALSKTSYGSFNPSSLDFFKKHCPETLHHFKYMSKTFYSDSKNLVYTPLPNNSNYRLCDSLIFDKSTNQILSSYEFKFQHNKLISHQEINKYSKRYSFISVLDIGYKVDELSDKAKEETINFVTPFTIKNTSFYKEIFEELELVDFREKIQEIQEIFDWQKSNNKIVNKFVKELLQNPEKLINEKS